MDLKFGMACALRIIQAMKELEKENFLLGNMSRITRFAVKIISVQFNNLEEHTQLIAQR